LASKVGMVVLIAVLLALPVGLYHFGTSTGPPVRPSLVVHPTVKPVAPVTPTISTTYSNFFNVTYGEWWDYRTSLYGDRAVGADCFNQTAIKDSICILDYDGDGKVTAESPGRSMDWYPTPVQNGSGASPTLYAPYRQSVVATNEPNYTLAKPVLFPTCNQIKSQFSTYGGTCPASPPTGGSFAFSWNMQYLDLKAATWTDNTCGTKTVSALDGFILSSNISLTMNLSTANWMFGSGTTVSGAQSWWGSHGDSACGTPAKSGVSTGFQTWLSYLGGSSYAAVGPYDIFSAYQYFYSPFVTYTTGSVAANGSTTVKIMHVAWGTEVLLDRLFFWGPAWYTGNFTTPAKHRGWAGQEMPWMEDVHLNGNISSVMNFTLNNVMEYHFSQGALPGPDGILNTTDDISTWLWQPYLADYIYSGTHNPDSELDAYTGRTYQDVQCGSVYYGKQVIYDYRPQSWLLGAGETMTIKFPTPSTTVPFCDVAKSPKNSQASALIIFNGTFELNATIPSSAGTFDRSTNTWTIVGPAANLNISAPSIGLPWADFRPYAPTMYAVTFTESGLPLGTSWSATLNGTTLSSSTSSIIFDELNGTYAFSVAPVSGYTPAPAGGSITVTGAPVIQTIVFSPAATYTVTFSESGLPGGTSWSVTLNGTTLSSTTSSIAFSQTNGTYSFSVPTITGYSANPSTGSVAVAGAPVSRSIVFTYIGTYTVTFTESGLPTGWSWSVTLAGATKSSTTNTITFAEVNGAYAFTVTASGYTASPSSGTITVSGGAQSQAITFTAIVTKYVVTFTETGLPSGTSWSVTLNGAPNSSAAAAITFKEVNGSYAYTVGSVSGYSTTNSSGSVTVSGANTGVTVSFTANSTTSGGGGSTFLGLPAAEGYGLLALIVIIVAAVVAYVAIRASRRKGSGPSGPAGPAAPPPATPPSTPP
jgi:hypothetical protein